MILMSSFFSNYCFADAKKVAVVKLIKGEADVLTLGKTTKLKMQDWVEDGAVVKTAEKSFVKLVFIDKSQMNVGPNSEMKIEKFDGKDSGVIDLVKGKIRSQVSKDYLQIQDKDKSKLFIKTPNAVMGIRGTDFMISTNGKNTSAVLFEGEVVFNRLDARSETSGSRLEEIVDRGVRMMPGEFSVVEQNRNQPTVPALLNIQQKEALEKAESFESERGPSNTDGGEDVTAKAKSVVPEGLSGEVTANTSEVLKKEVSQGDANNQGNDKSSNPNGFVDGDKVKPTNGSFLHVDSGIIIAPGSDSVLDSNTNTYIATSSSGTVASNGDYTPPANIEITKGGEILAKIVGTDGKPQIVSIPIPPPIMSTIPNLGSGGNVLPSPTSISGGILPKLPLSGSVLQPPLNDILSGPGTSSGGLMPIGNSTTTVTNDIRLTNQAENQSGAAATTIRVRGP